MTLQQDNLDEEKQPILKMRNITKRFPGVVALDDVTFEACAGEVHGLVGENGAGKSTLMNIISGFILTLKARCC